LVTKQTAQIDKEVKR